METYASHHFSLCKLFKMETVLRALVCCNVIYTLVCQSSHTPTLQFYGPPPGGRRCNTQSDENVTGPFTSIIWQETQIHRLMRTCEFNHKIWMWKYCAFMLLCYLICQWNQVWTKVIELHNISVWKLCKFPCCATATIINAMIAI